MNHSVFGWDYPPGAEHDSRAPYNQHDPIDCPECDGEGCDNCDWLGHLSPPSREEIETEKADLAMDRAKDADAEDQFREARSQNANE